MYGYLGVVFIVLEGCLDRSLGFIGYLVWFILVKVIFRKVRVCFGRLVSFLFILVG